MPIPVSELNKVDPPVRERILALLSQDQDQAYTLPEIYSRVEGVELVAGSLVLAFAIGTNSYAKLPVVLALDELHTSGLVKRVEHKGKTYYCIASGGA